MESLLTVRTVTWLTRDVDLTTTSPESELPMSGLCVRFVDHGDHVVVETLSTVDHDGGEVVDEVSSMGEAYDLARTLDLNVRYVRTVGPAIPLVVLR